MATTQIPGLTSYVGGLVSSLSTLEAPSAILAATEGIGLAALGLGKEAHIDLLYKSQVHLFTGLVVCVGLLCSLTRAPTVFALFLVLQFYLQNKLLYGCCTELPLTRVLQLFACTRSYYATV